LGDVRVAPQEFLSIGGAAGFQFPQVFLHGANDPRFRIGLGC
jgi:hypothetical protein